jgi:hypothetical protein
MKPVIPNGVLFKLDDGKPCVVLRKLDTWNWDLLLFPKSGDQWPDLSAKNPFEFVFIYKDENSLTTTNIKTTVPNHSFLSLHESDMLTKIIEEDYYRRYLEHPTH